MYTRSAVNAILARDLDAILLGLLDLLGSNSLVPNNKEFRRRVHPLTHLPVIGLDEKLTVLVKSHAFCLLVFNPGTSHQSDDQPVEEMNLFRMSKSVIRFVK